MNAIDRAILEACAADYHRLKELRGQISSGTLYRHTKRLCELGCLERKGPFYRATETGRRNLIEANCSRQWNQLEKIYPPLALIPTAVHRALIELIVAAIICRQHATRPDRHPFFVCAGGTLHWKTSAGIFVCHAVGLDPNIHVVDCGSEAGKSLFIRRTGTGAIASQRDLLNTAFVVLDEFLTADRAVRSALNPFLSGRLVVPCENERVTVSPVPFLTLNPREGAAVEVQFGLSAPLIRRAIIANVDTISMPDLAAMGQDALAAAQKHPPLTLSAPRVDCQRHHRAIVELVRVLLQPEAHDRVDVEVVVNLCTGMTALLPDAEDAIAQVCHRLGVLAETMQWARPGWIEGLGGFSLDGRPRPHSPHPASGTKDGQLAPIVAPEPPVLTVDTRPVRREPGLPSLQLSDDLRGQLTWLAVETGRSLEETIRLLLQHYRQWRECPETFSALQRSLELAHQLEIAQIEPQVLADYLQAEADLSRYGYTLQDVPQALRLITYLAKLPQPWSWERVRETIESLRLLIYAGITPAFVGEMCVLYERLVTLGFDTRSIEALATLLEQTCSTRQRRSRLLGAIVKLADDCVEVQDALAQRAHLTRELNDLERERGELAQRIEEAQTQLATLQQQEAQMQERLNQLEQETRAQASELEVLQALKAVLLGDHERADQFWQECDQWLEIRRAGPALPNDITGLLSARLREKILKLLVSLCAETEIHEKRRSEPEGANNG
jgi:predicted nuclease with TOPRIM domain